MKSLIYLIVKQQSKSSSQGFTLIEVLVSILMVVAFVLTATQAMVISTQMRIKAQRMAGATLWMQEEFEQLKQYATNYQVTKLTASATSGSSTLTVSNADDFALDQTITAMASPSPETRRYLKLSGDSKKYRITGVSGNTITVSPTLAQGFSSNASVVGFGRCTSYTIGTTTITQTNAKTTFAGGVADYFMNKRGSDLVTSYVVTSGSFPPTYMVRPTKMKADAKMQALLKDYRLYVTFSNDSSRLQVLQVQYQVRPVNSSEVAYGSPIAQMNTEVIPNAFFSTCDQ